MPQKSLHEMNKQMKMNMNEASGISAKCKRKLIQIVEKNFSVTLPKEDYKNMDIEILENGNIKMRDIEYPSSNKVTTKEDLIERFEIFQSEVDILLNKNATNFETMKKSGERNNLIVVILISFAMLVIALFSIRELLLGNLFGVLWLVLIIGYHIIPRTGNSIKNRYQKAWRYLKSIFKK